MKVILQVCVCLIISCFSEHRSHALVDGMLYPRDSETRTVKDLSGMWNFRADNSSNRNMGFEQQWWTKALMKSGNVIPMPVPSSYNDITQDKSLRDFVGWVWYDRQFFVPQEWKDKRVMLRVESAHYYSVVWVNGNQVMEHEGGHLPFECEINQYVNWTGANIVTIAVNNTLTPTTLPPGTIRYENDTNWWPSGYFVQNLQMDFFNYAGIQRPVKLYTTPKVFVDDITVTTSISDKAGVINYIVTYGGNSSKPSCTVSVVDKNGNSVQSFTHKLPDIMGNSIEAAAENSHAFNGQLKITNPHLWWPYTMNASDPGYMYTFVVALHANTSTDIYRQPVGVRTVTVTKNQFLINNKPFYCHGVAKHEDSDIRGKGLDYPLIARDFNLLKWLGTNCFRTSHYPYAEEIMDQADQQGIVVIDESPGVGIHAGNFGQKSLNHHLVVMEEMYRRDKNRPAVVMWSVANEPQSNEKDAEQYFKSVIGHVKSLDSTRPVTFVIGPGKYYTDKAAQFVDVLCINRYYGWYSDTGHTEIIQRQLAYDFGKWYTTFNKPIIITEYGADAVAGLHQSPSFVFTEEYQVDFMNEYFQAFDTLRKQFLVGEMVWNFADFATCEGVKRVDGNKKGVFTRQRQPKMAAHLLRHRYQNLIRERSEEMAKN